MKSVAVLLAPGFEEGEAIVTIDILRRLNITVQTIACGESREVVSYHAISMVADSTLKASFDCTVDAVVLPGGPEGSVNLAKSAEVIAFDDLKACGTMAAAKAKGLVRSEGKEYVMKDGDIVNFLFNV